MNKKKIKEEIGIRDFFIESTLKFIHNYLGSVIASQDKRKIRRCSIYKLAIDLEKKKSEIEFLESIK